MIVLGVDTCGAEGSLALVRVSEQGPERIEEIALTGRRYAGALIPALRALLGRHGVEVSGLSAVVVVHGPGSFTGIRMGLSLAKALSEAAGVPLVALSRLEVLARTHQAVSAVLDAGRGDCYFLDGLGESLLTAEEILVRLSPGSSLVACEASTIAALPAAELVKTPSAYEAVLLAQSRLAHGDFDDPATLDGNYVRRPEYRAATP